MKTDKPLMIRVPCQRCHPVAIKREKKTCPVCGGKGYVLVKAK